MYSSPSLPGILGAYFLKKKYKAKLIFDVRDIWPLTLIRVGGISKYHPLVLILRLFELFSYKVADEVTSNLPSMNKHVKSKINFTWIPNGVDNYETINPTSLNENYFPPYDSDKFIIGYAGALGKVNGIITLLKAAVLLKENKIIDFYIVGEGKDKAQYEKFIVDNNLTNVKFFPSVLKKQIFEVLNKFDACYLGWQNDELYNFGISPNKLPEYFFAKKPVIHSFSGSGDLVELANAGLTTTAEDSYALADAIQSMASKEKVDLNLYGNNGYIFAKENLTYDVVTKKLMKLLQ
jgi:glycosyltransferase involved in cell wall biosynthesis